MVQTYALIDSDHYRSTVKHLYKCLAHSTHCTRPKVQCLDIQPLDRYWNLHGLSHETATIALVEQGILCSCRDLITMANGVCVYVVEKELVETSDCEQLLNLSKAMIFPSASTIEANSPTKKWFQLLKSTPWSDITTIFVTLSHLCLKESDHPNFELCSTVKNNMVGRVVGWCERLKSYQQYIASQLVALSGDGLSDKVDFQSPETMVISWDVLMFACFCDGFLCTCADKDTFLQRYIFNRDNEPASSVESINRLDSLANSPNAITHDVVTVDNNQWMKMLEAILPLLAPEFWSTFDHFEMVMFASETADIMYPCCATQVLLYSFTRLVSNLLLANNNIILLGMDIVQQLQNVIIHIVQWCVERFKGCEPTFSGHINTMAASDCNHSTQSSPSEKKLRKTINHCTHIYCTLKEYFSVVVDERYPQILADFLLTSHTYQNVNDVGCALDVGRRRPSSASSDDLCSNFRVVKCRKSLSNHYNFECLARLEIVILEQLFATERVSPSVAVIIMKIVCRFIESPNSAMVHFYLCSQQHRKNMPQNFMFYHMKELCNGPSVANELSTSSKPLPAHQLVATNCKNDCSDSAYHHQMFLNECSTLCRAALKLVRCFQKQSNTETVEEFIKSLIHNLSPSNNSAQLSSFNEKVDCVKHELHMLLSLHLLGYISQAVSSNRDTLETIARFLLQITSSFASILEPYAAYQIALVLLCVQEDSVYHVFLQLISNVMQEIMDIVLMQDPTESNYKFCMSYIQNIMTIIAKNLQSQKMIDNFCDWIFDSIENICKSPEAMKLILTRSSKAKSFMQSLTNFLEPLSILVSRVSPRTNYTHSIKENSIPDETVDRYFNFWITMVMYCFGDSELCPPEAKKFLSHIAANTPVLIPTHSLRSAILNNSLVSSINLEEKSFYLKSVLKENLNFVGEPPNFFYRLRSYHLVFLHMVHMSTSLAVCCEERLFPVGLYYLECEKFQNEKIYLWSALLFVVESTFAQLVQSLPSDIQQTTSVHCYLREIVPYIVIKLNNNLKSLQRLTDKFLHIIYAKFPFLLCDKAVVRVLLDFLMDLYNANINDNSSITSTVVCVKGTHFSFLTKPIRQERYDAYLEFQSLIIDLIIEGIELCYPTMLTIFKDYALEKFDSNHNNPDLCHYTTYHIVRMMSMNFKSSQNVVRNESTFSVQSTNLLVNAPSIIIQDDSNFSKPKIATRVDRWELMERFLADFNHITVLHSNLLQKVSYNTLLGVSPLEYKKRMVESLRHSWKLCSGLGSDFIQLVNTTAAVFVQYKEHDKTLADHFYMSSVRFAEPNSLRNVIFAWQWVMNDCPHFETLFLNYLVEMWKYLIDNNMGIFHVMEQDSDPFLMDSHRTAVCSELKNQLDYQDILLDYMCFIVDNWMSVSLNNLAHCMVSVFGLLSNFIANTTKTVDQLPTHVLSHHVLLRCVLVFLKISKIVSSLYDKSHGDVKNFKQRVYRLCLKIICDKVGLCHYSYISQHRNLLALIRDTLTTDEIDLVSNSATEVYVDHAASQLNIYSGDTIGTGGGGAAIATMTSKEIIATKSRTFKKGTKKEKQNRDMFGSEGRSPTIVYTMNNIVQELNNVNLSLDVCLSHTKTVLLHLIGNYSNILNGWDYNNTVTSGGGGGGIAAHNLPLPKTFPSTTSFFNNIDYYKSRVGCDHIRNEYTQPAIDRQWNLHIKVISSVYPNALITLKKQFKSIVIVDKLVETLIYSDPLTYFQFPKAAAIFLSASTFPFTQNYVSLALVWKKPTFIVALQLLASEVYSSSAIFSQVAANIIEKTHMDTLIFYIPQLVQCLRDDLWSVMETLVYKLSSHTQLISHQFLWNIKANIYTDSEGFVKDPTFGDRLEQILDRINQSVPQRGLTFAQREFEFFNKVTSISGILKPYDKAKRKEICKIELSKIEPSIGVYLPTNPDSIVIGIDYDSGIPLQSAAKAPFLATFKVLELSCEQVESINLSPSYKAIFLEKVEHMDTISKSAIFKVGDDVRQDVLALQFMAIFKNIYESLGLKLFLLPYKVVATGAGSGVIECIPNAQSRDQLGKQTDVSLHTYFLNLYGNENTLKYQQARLNFVESMAAYSILTYLLQVKDRHNGNIMINKDGYIIHIDFGFIFDSSPGGNLKFEPNMKITEEMLNIMGGNTESAVFKYFLQECVRAFLALRPYADYFTFIVSHMLNSNLPCFRGDTIKRFRARFNPDVSESEAINFITKIVSDSVLNYRTKLYDILQYAQNEIPY